MKAQVGRTKDVGYQFGLRKTFSISVEQAWKFLFSENGLKVWLGDLETEFLAHKDYKTKNGIEGHVRVFKPFSHTRISWKKRDWQNLSTLQVRVIEKGNDKAVISFHQEKLKDAQQREEMKTYWNAKMNSLSNEVEKLTSG